MSDWPFHSATLGHCIPGYGRRLVSGGVGHRVAIRNVSLRTAADRLDRVLPAPVVAAVAVTV